jgi:hypothetical protein
VIDREGELELDLQDMTEQRDHWKAMSRKHEKRAKTRRRALQALAAALADALTDDERK